MQQLLTFNDCLPFNLEEIHHITIYLIISKELPCIFCDRLLQMDLFNGLLQNSAIPIDQKIYDWKNIEDKKTMLQLKKVKNITKFPTMEIKLQYTNYIIDTFWGKDNEGKLFLNPRLLTFWNNLIVFDRLKSGEKFEGLIRNKLRQKNKRLSHDLTNENKDIFS